MRALPMWRGRPVPPPPPPYVPPERGIPTPAAGSSGARAPGAASHPIQHWGSDLTKTERWSKGEGKPAGTGAIDGNEPAGGGGEAKRASGGGEAGGNGGGEAGGGGGEARGQDAGAGTLGTGQPSRAPAEAYRRLAALYRELDAEIARLAPRCDGRGICCDFDRVDHVLFASKLEMDYAKDHRPEERWRRPAGNVCPFLDDAGRCGARKERMLGCRTYFCQEGWGPIGAELYERYYARVKEIARSLGLEWRYAPALEQLREPEGCGMP